MNYLREFLYRPKRSDTSLMARFFRADENLTAVAQELDSFDGRKDPERCASLVNKLRSCQDKLLSICNKMLEEVEPGYSSRLREHRAKFPGKTLFYHRGQLLTPFLPLWRFCAMSICNKMLELGGGRT